MRGVTALERNKSGRCRSGFGGRSRPTFQHPTRAPRYHATNAPHARQFLHAGSNGDPRITGQPPRSRIPRAVLTRQFRYNGPSLTLPALFRIRGQR